MSMRDPETGQFMSADGSEADYSDYEYQQIEIQHPITNSDGGDEESATALSFGVEPLGARGGLDTNEVAELVAMRYQVIIEPEPDGTQQTVGQVEFRGSIGSDLDSLRDIVNGGGAGTADNAIGPADAILSDPDGVYDARDSNPGQIDEFSRAEVFEVFQETFTLAHQGETGPGGGAGLSSSEKRSVNFRALTGRGPVLDASDELSIATTLIKDNVFPTISGIVSVHLVWDVATVDDAGRAFSVPSDD